YCSSQKSENAPNLANILEYLEVPSHFVGTETVLDAQTFQWDGTGTEPAETLGLHPPFNAVSNYRDPGKVNINTIAGRFNGTEYVSEVWNAVLGSAPESNPALGPTFKDFALSRQGYGTVPYSFDTTGTYPSMFSNPFRSA